ncbi:unnamed protein product [Ascophyllum nodosum]
MSPCTKKTHSEKRLELHRLLLSKLIGKYGAHSDDSGVGTELHPANEFIQAEVDLFMHNHDSVRAGDLAKLERTIRHATQSAGDHYNHNSRKVVQSRGGATSGERLQNIDSSSHDYSYTPKNRDDASVQGGTPRVSDPTRSRSSPDMARKIGPRATTSGGRVTSCGRDQDQFARRQSASSLPAAEKQSKRERGSCSVPPSKYSNWLTLQTYQQLVVEDKDDEDQRKKREASQRCKQGQVGQIRQNLERAEENKREAARAKEEQRRLIAEHESHQALLRDAAKKKVLEERCARAHQMLENERRRGKERHEEQVDNEKILATCKKELREEQEAQFKKRKEVAQSLRAMYRENIAKLAERERQKALEAEEDRRLMEEYRKKLDRGRATSDRASPAYGTVRDDRETVGRKRRGQEAARHTNRGRKEVARRDDAQGEGGRGTREARQGSAMAG